MFSSTGSLVSKTETRATSRKKWLTPHAIYAKHPQLQEQFLSCAGVGAAAILFIQVPPDDAGMMLRVEASSNSKAERCAKNLTDTQFPTTKFGGGMYIGLHSPEPPTSMTTLLNKQQVLAKLAQLGVPVYDKNTELMIGPTADDKLRITLNTPGDPRSFEVPRGTDAIYVMAATLNLWLEATIAAHN